jgi:hypothetical protein
MAPEQIEEKAVVDVRADIYSLGCTLFKLLTGHAPFTGRGYETAFEKMNAHLKKAPPQVRALRQDVPTELAAMIYRMMAKSPDARFATPGEVADAIGPMAAGSDLAALISRAQGTPVAPPSQVYSATEPSLPSSLTRMIQQFAFKKRHRAPRPATKTNPWMVGAVIFAALVLVPLLAVGIWWAVTPPGPQREVAQKADTVEEDNGKKTTPPKAAPSYLILQCPARDLEGASVRVDGKHVDISGQGDTGEVRVALKAGAHKIEINRVGYETIRRPVSIPEGTNFAFEPVWRRPSPDKEPKPAGPTPLEHVADQGASKPPGKPTPEPKKEGPPPLPAPMVTEEERKKIEELEKAEARYAETLKVAEARLAVWDFAGAKEELDKPRFDDPEHSKRLAALRGAVGRLAVLKGRMISRINKADPPLKKRALMLQGMDGDVTKADEKAIFAESQKGSEEFAWQEINVKARQRLLLLVIERSADAGDWLAAGVSAVACADAPFAERCLANARRLGARTDAYVVAPIVAAFFHAWRLIKDEKYVEADGVLKDMTQRYGDAAWLESNRQAVEAVEKLATTGRREAEAAELYTRAAAYFRQKQLFDVRPLVEKLTTGYADTRAVVDAARNPTVAEMAKAAGDLGKFFTVRQDGKGHFKSIQAAIDKAPPNSMIEIQDNGPYREGIRIKPDTPGLTIRGHKSFFPVLTSPESGDTVVTIEARNTTLQRLALVAAGGFFDWRSCLAVISDGCRLQSLICGQPGIMHSSFDTGVNSEIEGCFFGEFPGGGGGLPHVVAPAVIRDSIFMCPALQFWENDKIQLDNSVAVKLAPSPTCQLSHCTITDIAELNGLQPPDRVRLRSLG